MMSMARATSANSTSLSPLTKAIFSARSLKICSMRGPRPSQVESSLLILTLPFISTCTTTVLFSNSWFCCWLGLGCGTRVSSPLGVRGVMTMKIINSTSRMSMSGTTFISAMAPPLLSPTCIPIELSPVGPPLASVAGRGAAPSWEPALRGNRKRQQTNVTTRPRPPGLIRRRRRRRRSVPLIALRQQPDLIHARGADLIDHRDNVAILGARVALHVHHFFQPVGDAVFHLRHDLFLGDAVAAQEDVAVAGDGHHDGVVFIGVLHVLGVVGARQVHLFAFLQHGGDDHEDDQQHKHDVRHGNDVRR